MNEDMQYASVGSRFVAVCIDGLILLIPNLIVQQVLDLSWAGMIISIAYSVYFLSKTGATPGKKAMGVVVVKEDGNPLTVTDALVRSLSTILSGLALSIGYFWALFDKRKQTWHDKIACTLVLKVAAVNANTTTTEATPVTQTPVQPPVTE